MLIGNEVELENETSFVLRVFLSYCKQQIDANVEEKKKYLVYGFSCSHEEY